MNLAGVEHDAARKSGSGADTDGGGASRPETRQATTLEAAAENVAAASDGHERAESTGEGRDEPGSGATPDAKSKSAPRRRSRGTSRRPATERDGPADDTHEQSSQTTQPKDAGTGDTVDEIKRPRRTRARTDAEEAA